MASAAVGEAAPLSPEEDKKAEEVKKAKEER